MMSLCNTLVFSLLSWNFILPCTNTHAQRQYSSEANYRRDEEPMLLHIVLEYSSSCCTTSHSGWGWWELESSNNFPPLSYGHIVQDSLPHSPIIEICSLWCHLLWQKFWYLCKRPTCLWKCRWTTAVQGGNHAKLLLPFERKTKEILVARWPSQPSLNVVLAATGYHTGMLYWEPCADGNIPSSYTKLIRYGCRTCHCLSL